MTDSSSDQSKKVEKLVDQDVKDDQEHASSSTDSTDMTSIEADLAAGARAFAFKNYATATECFSKACEKLTTHHSENHAAIIDAHIFYGKALLRNAISLGSVLGGIDHKKANEEEQESHEASVNGQPNPQATSSNPTGVPSSSKVSSGPPLKGLNKTPQIHFSGDSSDGENEGEDEDEPADDHEAAEEPVTVEEELENAFHVLEFARQSIQSQIDTNLINQKPSDDTERLQNKLIDVYDLIAQVHQEGEQFEMAVEAYKNSLQIKKSRSDIKAGTVAETHLMIALALELIPDDGESMKQAINHVDEAIDLMKGHLSHLNEKFSAIQTEKDSSSKPVEPSEESTENNSIGQDDAKPGGIESSKLRSEIEETKSLIDELEAKKEELKTIPQPPPLTDADKALQAYLNSLDNNGNGNVNGKAIVNDLSNLVKKRSRPVEASEPPSSSSGPLQAEPPEPSSKKPKT